MRTRPNASLQIRRVLALSLVALLTGRPPATAADDVPEPQVEYSAIQATRGGVQIYVPGKWGILNLDVTNPLSEPREVLSTTYFVGHPTLQFGRRIWVPARSRLRTWQPVLPPDLPPGGTERFEFRSLVLDATKSVDVARRDDTGQILHSGFLPAQLDVPITGMIFGLDGDPRRDSNPDRAADLAAAIRVSQRLNTRLAGLWDRHYVPDDVSLRSLHQLIVADSRALNDPAGVAAVRRWVHAGGRLWVMLDRVDPRYLERILGDEFQCTVVDRVSLTDVRIESASKTRGTPPVEAEYEQPVELLRLEVDEVDVAYTVNGWPAAFWKSFGSGRVLATTLEPRGWLRLRTAADPKSAVPSGPWVPVAPMVEIAKEFLPLGNAPPEVQPLLEQQAIDYIGYSIPPRSQVAGLLGGFVAAVGILGTWLLRRRALEHLGWLAPGLAIAVAAALMIIGGLNRHTIPATAATVEFVEAIPGTDDIRARGVVELYNPEAAPGKIGGTRGGRLLPDLTGLEGVSRRMVWKDLDVWNWENLEVPAGQRLGTYVESETLAVRVEARAAFGPEGLTGRLAVPDMTSASDALIATGYGRMGVELRDDGAIRAVPESVFGRDQYLAANLLNDEQNRRRQTYSKVLPALFQDNPSAGPWLFVWADRRDAGFRFDENRRLLGASLMAVPLVIERPTAGTLVRIPSPFLPFRGVPRPDGAPSSHVWDHRRLEWQARSAASETWLRFQLPAGLLPIQLTQARLVIQVKGPMGRLEVAARRRGGGRAEDSKDAALERDQVVSLKTWRDPVGTLPALDVKDRSLLVTDAGGGFVLGLFAGETDPSDLPSAPADGTKTWQIEHLSLELSGTYSP